MASARVDEFDAGAMAYDRFRPRYPPGVFDDFVALAELQEGGRVLEVGSGTGIATEGLIVRGLQVLSVEPAPRMAAIAQAKCGDRGSIIVSRFEDMTLEGSFDAIVAFNAWHWVTPTSGLDLVARLLRPGGALAVVWTDVISWGQPPFEELLEQRLGASWPKSITQVASSFDPVSTDGRFRDIATRRHRFSRTMDSPTFLAVTHTYGGDHPPEVDEVLTDIIDNELGGEVTKVEDAILRVARRR
jgi:SAM-dependent methyltransferase